MLLQVCAKTNIVEAPVKVIAFARGYKGEKAVGNNPGKDLKTAFRIQLEPRLLALPSERDGFDSLYADLTNRFEVRYNATIDNDGGILVESLLVRFPSDDVADCISASNEVWSKSTRGNSLCIQRCNGFTQTRHMEGTGNSKELATDPIPCAAKLGDSRCPKGCKPQGMTTFYIEGIGYPAAVIEMPLSSGIDIKNLTGFLKGKAEMGLSSVVFRLFRQESQILINTAQGKTIPTPFWGFCLDMDWMQSKARLEARRPAPGLPAAAGTEDAPQFFAESRISPEDVIIGADEPALTGGDTSDDLSRKAKILSDAIAAKKIKINTVKSWLQDAGADVNAPQTGNISEEQLQGLLVKIEGYTPKARAK